MSDNPLEEFARDAEPQVALRQRVERSLRERQFLAPAGRQWRAVILAASLVLAAGVGFAAGRAKPSPTAHGGPEFLLLLREDSTYRDDRPTGDIVREYGRWADSLRGNDQLVLASRLGDDRADVVRPGVEFTGDPREGPTTGFFLVRAPDLASAQSIAASSPHVKYGGRIVVRSIR
jgi:hypothetical protein